MTIVSHDTAGNVTGFDVGIPVIFCILGSEMMKEVRFYDCFGSKESEEDLSSAVCGTQVQALSCVNFSVEEGEYVAIMGESGSGKTTLLNLLAALDKPTEGEVYLKGKPLSSVKDKNISQFRRDISGLCSRNSIFWIRLTSGDNILLPLVLKGGRTIKP